MGPPPATAAASPAPARRRRSASPAGPGRQHPLRPNPLRQPPPGSTPPAAGHLSRLPVLPPAAFPACPGSAPPAASPARLRAAPRVSGSAHVARRLSCSRSGHTPPCLLLDCRRVPPRAAPPCRRVPPRAAPPCRRVPPRTAPLRRRVRPPSPLPLRRPQPEMVVGWYHSHPGFGCWLSGVDINSQQSFEALNPRAVAVVIDPIQSVKGKVVIDAFRLINPKTMMLGQEPRQTTSNVGHLNKPYIQALVHGLNRHYYSIAINYGKTSLRIDVCPG